MRVTAFTDYCLRALMYVGSRESGLSTIDEIARSYGISDNHLRKVVYQLGQLGYLKNTRGKGGGIRLAKAPEEINLGALVRQTEEGANLVQCFMADGPGCRIQSACVLRGVLGEALGAFYAVLDGYTLADLLAPRRRLAGLLGMPARPAASSGG